MIFSCPDVHLICINDLSLVVSCLFKFIIIIILFAQIMSKQIHWRQYNCIQSVSKTYQAHTSTNGSLIITSNIQR